MNNYWDGKNVHFCYGGPGQSAQEAEMVCGIILSTWAGPNAKGTTTELKVGYSFQPDLIDCKKCIKWCKEKFTLCDKGCGRICCYETCCWCVEKNMKFCVCGGVWDEEMPDLEYHNKSCTGRKKR